MTKADPPGGIGQSGAPRVSASKAVLANRARIPPRHIARLLAAAEEAKEARKAKLAKKAKERRARIKLEPPTPPNAADR